MRLLLLLSGLGVLGMVSAVFGMMMAVASDLPEIDVLDVSTRPSYILDRNGEELGILTGNENRLLVKSTEISPAMKQAIVAIEDRRFYTNSGVDLRAIARATVNDVISGSAEQGGSTIAQQLVKNRLEAQDDRTVFQKMREAAMAFHMTRKWDKERILRNYLNTIYFGNGAYGIEAAARTYFGKEFGLDGTAPQCGSGETQQRCAALLDPAQAALLAGVVASPGLYDPVTNPVAAEQRRDLVLLRMREQGYLTQLQYEEAIAEIPPGPEDVQPPDETADFPYFTTWVRQQVVDQVGASRAFEGGLRVETTIDAELQQAATEAVDQWLGTPGFNGVPAASMVVLDNDTSEVLAMVGGDDDQFDRRPFNLATQGQRQPGSSFKPFILAEALEQGVSPYRTFTSAQKEICVTEDKDGNCTEAFIVNNYDDNYSGIIDLAGATAFSDNSVYAELGVEVGTKKVAAMAHSLGVRTPISTNYAMTLGGLEEGVTVLDMAHAYQSFATGGELVYGSLSPGADAFEKADGEGTVPGPVGIRSILEPDGDDDWKAVRLPSGAKATNKTERKRVLDEGVAATVQSLLSSVVSIGTGKRAAVSGVTVAGKTGTTENYGDAWFVGWTEEYTVAIWVGYPNRVKPMDETNFTYQGEPVAGGTYPASIFASFINAALTINPDDEDEETTEDVPVTSAPVTEAPEEAPVEEAPVDEAPVEEEPVAPAPEAPAPEAPAPEAPAPEAPAPPTEPAVPPPTDGGGGGAVAAPSG